jgi:hypothetical protein
VPSAAAPTSCGGGDLAVDRGPYVIAGMQVPGFFPNMGPSGWQKDDVAIRQVVVVGRVVAQEEAAFGGEARVYTPFVVEVDHVIHGEAGPGTLRVSIEGGTVGCYSVNVDTVPHLQTGRRYVFFLTGSAHSDPPPEVWDVWMVDNHDIVSTYQGPMPLTSLSTGSTGWQPRRARLAPEQRPEGRLDALFQPRADAEVSQRVA